MVLIYLRYWSKTTYQLTKDGTCQATYKKPETKKKQIQARVMRETMSSLYVHSSYELW